MYKRNSKIRVGLFGAAAATLVAGAAFAQSPAASYTEAQAERGKKSYSDNCAGCHGDKMEGDGERTPAFGGTDFDMKWIGKPIDGFWNFMTKSMPMDKPGELPAQTYADIFAYVLKFNGVPAGQNEFPANPTMGLQIRRR